MLFLGCSLLTWLWIVMLRGAELEGVVLQEARRSIGTLLVRDMALVVNKYLYMHHATIVTSFAPAQTLS